MTGKMKELSMQEEWEDDYTWDDASARHVDSIITKPHAINDLLRDLRDMLNFMIDAFWGRNKVDDILMDDSRSLSWLRLGRIAAAYGYRNKIYKKGPNTSIDLAALLVRKQHDYGHENIARFGAEGLLVRVHDKVARLENLTGWDKKPKMESVKDTIDDIIGYCVIGLMIEDDTFFLELKSSTVVEE